MDIFSIVYVLVCYLIGSINSSIVLSKIFSIPDPRTYGSSNPGATNVVRQSGMFFGVLTFGGDLMKALIPLFIVSLFNSVWLDILCANAILLGHIFPAYFRFKGGKGVATYIGILIALNSMTALCFLLIWVTLWGVYKNSGFASIVTTFVIICISLLVVTNPVFSIPVIFDLFGPVMLYWYCIVPAGILIIWRHKNNLLEMGYI